MDDIQTPSIRRNQIQEHQTYLKLVEISHIINNN